MHVCCLSHIGIAIGAVGVREALRGDEGIDDDPLISTVLNVTAVASTISSAIIRLVVITLHVFAVRPRLLFLQ